MAKVITLAFDAKLAPFVRSAVQAAQKIQHIAGATKKLTSALGKTATAAEKTGTALEKKGRAAGRGASSMGELTTRLRSMLGPAAVLTAGVALLTKGLRAMVAESDRAKQRLTELADPTKLLQQIATSPADFLELQAKARALAKREGMTEEQALRTTYFAYSGMVGHELGTIGKASRFMQPQAAAELIGALSAKATFGEAAGTGEQIFSQVIKAARESAFSTEQMKQAAILSSSGAKQVGASLPEMLGVIAATSQAFAGAPERSATAMRAVASALAKGIEVERVIPKQEALAREAAGETVSRRKTLAGKEEYVLTEQVELAGQGLLAGLQRLRTEFPEQYAEMIKREKQFRAGALAIEGDLAAIPGAIALIRRDKETLEAWHSQLKTAELAGIAAPREEKGAAEGRRITEVKKFAVAASRRAAAIDHYADESLGADENRALRMAKLAGLGVHEFGEKTGLGLPFVLENAAFSAGKSGNVGREIVNVLQLILEETGKGILRESQPTGLYMHQVIFWQEMRDIFRGGPGLRPAGADVREGMEDAGALQRQGETNY